MILQENMASELVNFEGVRHPCRDESPPLASGFTNFRAKMGVPVRLKDKVAIITGAGRGIGRDIALAYAREGAKVVVNDIDPQTAESTAKDVGGLAVVADVAKSADIARLVETTIKEFGRIDILVNNA